MKKAYIFLFLTVFLMSCVSKKKYVALEQEKSAVSTELTKTKVEKEELEAKFDRIQARVDEYNAKIQTLNSNVKVLSLENDSNVKIADDGAVISEASKRDMLETLTKVDPYELSQATCLKDSMNLAVAYNLKRMVDTSSFNEDEDIAIDINETVVMISISDNMLFNPGSFRISSKSNNILQKLADVINSEPSIEVMVEGHTDSRAIRNTRVADNWDLSVLRATSVVRKLQNDYGVAPEKLLASGRSFHHPVTDNDSDEGRSRNRRTRIIILPNINKFFALLASN